MSLLLLTSCSITDPKTENSPAPRSFSFIASTQQPEDSWKMVSAAEKHFVYEGRLDPSDPSGPIVIWQASRIHITFEGERLALLFDQNKGQNFFDVEIDGAKSVLGLRDASARRFVTAQPLSQGRHVLTLFKRNEAASGTVQFKGIEVSRTARTWQATLPEYKTRMEFLGDSITVGACNEDGETDQWEDRSTHNSALSYAAMTAKAFAADHRNISVSGMGVCTGWVEKRTIEIWDRLYPEISSARANLASWQPDIVFVNYGENDDSFSRSKGRPFPDNFADEYVRLILAVRQAYPKARIVLLRGGMYGGSQSAPLRQAWESAVARLESKDPRISHFVFEHWAKNHPRVADDRAMADELIAWLSSP